MLTFLGFGSVSCALLLLGAICTTFFWLSTNISYNPCFLNVYKDDVRQYIITGILHACGLALLLVVQLLSHLFSPNVALHLNGSIQILSLIPTLMYYHVLVVTYKHRYLEVRHRGHIDYRKQYVVECLAIMGYFLIAAFVLIIFLAELSFPEGIYSPMHFDQNSGWGLEDYEVLAILIVGIGTFLLLVNLFRVTRNSYYIKKVYNEPEETTAFLFVKYVSKLIEPHFVNDLLTLFLPAQYLVLRVSVEMQLNGVDVFAKCLLIVHPAVFTAIYMFQIKMASRNADPAEMKCRCCVCHEIEAKQSRSRFAWLEPLRSWVRRENSEARGSAAADGQPTETTPATGIQVSEDL